jgi:hypothetical protein
MPHEAPLPLEDRRQADLTQQIGAPVPDAAAAFAATQAPAPATASAGPPDPAAAYSTYATETTRSTTTQGLSDKDAAAQRDLLGTAKGAQERATGSEVEARRVAIEADEREQTLRLNEAAEEQKKLAAKQAVLDLQESEVTRKLQAGSDWRPDRAELFSGSTGAARGILAAISVIAGGLMQGRGMTKDNQFLSAIQEMIAENVADQVRQNSASIQFLREQKGDIHSAAAELKKRQLDFATQKLNARAQLSKIPAAQAGLTAFNDAAAARTAEWQAEQEKALRKQVSSTISRHTAPVGPGKAPERPGERSEAQAKAKAASDAIDALAKEGGFILNPKTGEYEVGGGAVPPLLLEQLNPFSERRGVAAFDAAVEAFGRQQSGGVIGADERPAFVEQLGGGGAMTNRAQMAARLNAARKNIDAKMKSDDAKARDGSVKAPEGWR